MLATEPGTTIATAQRLLADVERVRITISPQLDTERKARLGQFFTPGPLARLMCSMLTCPGPIVRILDAGAGVGTLFATVVAELCTRSQRPQLIHVTAYELDETLIPSLRETLERCRITCERVGIAFSGEVRHADFIRSAVALLQGDLSMPPSAERYDCAILNPPYRKIQTQSEERQLLRRIGVETTNLYAGFLAAAAHLLDPMGELVAITPRSFCNGPYFKGFRRSFLGLMALRRIHLFESRSDAFREDTVLQENVIIAAVRATTPPDSVTITTGTAAQGELLAEHRVPYATVVAPGDPQAFIRIVPDEIGQRITARLGTLHTTLAALGISVSTGRVVDFRVREHLRPHSGPDTAPLIYPAHFSAGRIAWPGTQTRKPNALALAGGTRAQLVPNATYVLVKRFSSKEERRRIVAAVIAEGQLPGTALGFENHLNYFHRGGTGLDLALAHGLATFLNSTLVDEHFRQFNGHTQVNATDLRNISYPTPEQLRALGVRVGPSLPAQHTIDSIIEEELFAMQGDQERDPLRTKRRIAEALAVLKALGLPKAQQNERSALTLLALLHLGPETPWSEATAPLLGITPMMDYFYAQYGKCYAPNTRETVRRQTVHQFRDAALVLANSDGPQRPINSGKTVYQIEPSLLALLRSYGEAEWEKNLEAYTVTAETLGTQYAEERSKARLPVTLPDGTALTLSPGGQNVLIEQVLALFLPRFVPDGAVLYIGDADEKFAYYDESVLHILGVTVDRHGKMPDVIIYSAERKWLILVEAVTSHGPVDAKRHRELATLFHSASVGLVFVTAFLTRKAMATYLDTIAWETEVWVAEASEHLIHFNGERFLGPY